MKYLIVFNSRTGNTAGLAEEVRSTLSKEDCVYFGGSDYMDADTPLIFVGFWTDKGTCDINTANYLKDLKDKNVFLFGTAGFGGSTEYFDHILDSTIQNLNKSCKVIGSFMCQGRMPISVRERYEKMLTSGAGDTKINEMLKNFDSAVTHPDGNDLEQLKITINTAIDKL